jgi:hypothetical protein
MWRLRCQGQRHRALARSVRSSRRRATASWASTRLTTALVVGGDRLALQTVDYFRAIVDDPYTLSKIAPTIRSATSPPWAASRRPRGDRNRALRIEAKVGADLSR